MLITHGDSFVAPRPSTIALTLALGAPVSSAVLGLASYAAITATDPFSAETTWVSMLFLGLQFVAIVSFVTASTLMARRYLGARPAVGRWPAWVAIGLNALSVVAVLLPVAFGLVSLSTAGAIS
ncbi:hypothetical protein ACEXQB_000365 [Herbiconiux sp. P18]|uniref:hypothetical protein n=1 Tax=Herbiconiux liangxiaofengii TaxID=3342795 RepID=UPI0035B981E8